MKAVVLLALHLLALCFILCNANQNTVNPRGWRAATVAGRSNNAHLQPQTQGSGSLLQSDLLPPVWVAGLLATLFTGLFLGYVLGKAQVSRTITYSIQPGALPPATPAQQSQISSPAANVEQQNITAAHADSGSHIVANGDTEEGSQITVLPSTASEQNTIITTQTQNNKEDDDIQVHRQTPTELEQQNSDNSSVSLEMQQAAKLVSNLTEAMKIDVAALSPSERLQLMNIVVQAWHTQEAKKNAEVQQQQTSEANTIRRRHTDIAQTQADHTLAKDANALASERTKLFHQTCSDVLLTGVLLMLAIGARQAYLNGAIQPLFNKCGGVSRRGSLFGFWTAWRSIEVVFCYIAAAGNAVIGVFVLLAAPFLLYRSGFLNDYHSTPVFKLLAGLGLVCGFAGYIAVDKMGGAAWPWLVCWETWVLVHIALSVSAHRLHRRMVHLVLLRNSDSSVDSSKSEGLYSARESWLNRVMWLVVGGVLPVITALVPFLEIWDE